MVMLGVPAIVSAEEIDMAKVTCKEFLESKENMPVLLTWIDGYMSAQSDNTVMSSEWMETLATHMGKFCAANPGKTIMDAMEAMPAE